LRLHDLYSYDIKALNSRQSNVILYTLSPRTEKNITTVDNEHHVCIFVIQITTGVAVVAQSGIPNRQRLRSAVDGDTELPEVDATQYLAVAT